jgi:hypothetical protein
MNPHASIYRKIAENAYWRGLQREILTKIRPFLQEFYQLAISEAVKMSSGGRLSLAEAT